MKKGIRKDTRMVWWSVELGLRNFTWFNIAWCGRCNVMTKAELKKFLSTFSVKDWLQFDIISVKIIRNKRLGTTTMYESETFGYTDVTPQGTLSYIEL